MADTMNWSSYGSIIKYVVLLPVRLNHLLILVGGTLFEKLIKSVCAFSQSLVSEMPNSDQVKHANPCLLVVSVQFS
jgi:hypothetical protein